MCSPCDSLRRKEPRLDGINPSLCGCILFCSEALIFSSLSAATKRNPQPPPISYLISPRCRTNSPSTDKVGVTSIDKVGAQVLYRGSRSLPRKSRMRNGPAHAVPTQSRTSDFVHRLKIGQVEDLIARALKRQRARRCCKARYGQRQPTAGIQTHEARQPTSETTPVGLSMASVSRLAVIQLAAIRLAARSKFRRTTVPSPPMASGRKKSGKRTS